MNRRILAVLVAVAIACAITSFLAWLYTTPAQFTLDVVCRPKNPPGTEGHIVAIAGQTCVFLVVVKDEEGWLQGRAGLREAAKISTSGSGTTTSVIAYPELIVPGQVAEVTVIPDVASINDTLAVTIGAERKGIVKAETVTIEVVPGEDHLIQQAREMRDMFTPWLAEHHPDLGITNETEWTGTIVNPKILVVTHYIFYSDEWEMYLTWHVTIPPHDWTKIYLRRRFAETRPSHAFEVSSVTAQEEPHAIEVPDWV